MHLFLPAFVVATTAVLLWALVAFRSRPFLPVTTRQRIALGVGLVLGLLPALGLLVIPMYGIVTTTMRTGGAPTSSSGAASLLEVEGPSVLVPLALPLMLVMAPMLARRASERRAITRLAAILMTVFVVAGSFTIGLFFLPAAIALWAAIPPGSSAERPA
jgi:hypothetical protein